MLIKHFQGAIQDPTRHQGCRKVFCTIDAGTPQPAYTHPFKSIVNLVGHTEDELRVAFLSEGATLFHSLAHGLSLWVSVG